MSLDWLISQLPFTLMFYGQQFIFIAFYVVGFCRIFSFSHFRQISKISDLFKTILLIQLFGSLGTQIFSLYVLQSHFYFTMLFAAASPVGQVFMYCYLGDLLTQKVKHGTFGDVDSAVYTNKKFFLFISRLINFRIKFTARAGRVFRWLNRGTWLW